MSKAAYWQRGETLDYANNTEKIIEAGTIVELAERIGIAGDDIPPGKTGTLHVSGVYEFTKTSTNAIPIGTSVLFDGNGITEAEGGTPAGFAAAESAETDTTILVKIG